jgi:hypothetical protein
MTVVQSEPPNERENMKTTISLIALSVLTALSFSAPVFGQVKGGEKLVGVRPIVNTTAPAAAMSCPSEMRFGTDESVRGAFKKVTVYNAHLCPSCKNKEVVTGAGKLATRKVEHSCKMATVCCNVKS